MPAGRGGRRHPIEAGPRLPIGRAGCAAASAFVYSPPQRASQRWASSKKHLHVRHPQAADFDRFRLRRFIESLNSDRTRNPRRTARSRRDRAGAGRQRPRGAVPRRRARSGRNSLPTSPAAERGWPAPSGSSRARWWRKSSAGCATSRRCSRSSRGEAPVQEIVLTGDQADLTTLPVHLGHGADGGPYISASVDFVVDPRTGLTNVGMRRLMLRGRRETGIDLVSPSDLRAIYEASAAAGKPLPVSFVVGSHPVDQVAAMMRLPVDELGLISALRDAPLPVVKCVTNDIRVPADAEWVLEGYLDAARARRARRPVRRVSRLLRRAQAQPGVPPHRDHAPARRAVPDRDHRRPFARPHRHRAALRPAHRGDDLACARNRGARAGRRLCHHLERRHVQPAGRAAPARAGRGAQRHRGLLRRARQRQERVRGRSRHRHLLRRADGLGAGDALPGRPRPHRGRRPAHPAARSLGDAGHAHRRQGGLRPDLAVRHRRPARNARAGAAAVCGRALCVGRSGAGATGRNISRS